MIPTASSDLPMPANAPAVVPAATVIVFRHAAQDGPPELLMVQRAKEMRFAGGAAVFPGGRVDPADYDLARALIPGEPVEIAAAKVAAVRETLEETGLMIATRTPVPAAQAAESRKMLLETGALAPVLEAFGWELLPEALAFYAHWCPQWATGFDTRFFIFDIGTGAVDITVDATENTRLFWTSAAGALDMVRSGEINVIFPTHRNLERLAQYTSFTDALSDIAAHPVSRVHPAIEDRDGKEWLAIPDRHGYPVLAEPLEMTMRGLSQASLNAAPSRPSQ